MNIPLIVKPLEQVNELDPHGDDTFETEMAVVSLEYILDAESQLFLNDVWLSPDFSEAVDHWEPLQLFVT